jgi:hypothetical protein
MLHKLLVRNGLDLDIGPGIDHNQNLKDIGVHVQLKGDTGTEIFATIELSRVILPIKSEEQLF